MSATTADLFDMYPRHNVRHLIGALVLLSLLNLLPIIGIGPTSWRQCLGVADTEAAITPAPQVLPTPTPMEPPAPPTQSTPAVAAPDAPATATSASAPTAPAPAPVSEPLTIAAAPATPAPVSTTTARAVIFFDEDDDDLPADARGRLAQIVAFLKAETDAKVRISGYHDRRGDLLYNEDLAYRRALEVRAALERAGIRRDRIIIAKPAKMTDSGKQDRAQRTEVTIVR